MNMLSSDLFTSLSMYSAVDLLSLKNEMGALRGGGAGEGAAG